MDPMLARLTRALPAGDFVFEPKWDGFRCLSRRAGDDVDLRSRNARPLSRYFPELVAALQLLPTLDFVVDGEIVVPAGVGSDFPALMARLHPAASRVARLASATPPALILLTSSGSTAAICRPSRSARAARCSATPSPIRR